MQPLYCAETDRIDFRGRRVWLLNSFDRVLKCCALLREEVFTPLQRIDLCLRLLLRRPGRWLRRRPEERIELFHTIWKELLPPARSKAQSNGPRALDFDLDAAYIFASFWQAYGIDLIKEQGRLSWGRFLALFDGLPEDTKIRQVMDIRTRELPVPTRYNQKEIGALRRLKACYALPGAGGENYRAGLSRLFDALKNQAVKKA